MAQVNPDDDDIERFIVYRYTYDPARHERRHVIVVAFDNEQEFEAAITTLARELVERRGSGVIIDSQEHISGAVLKPGHRRQQRNGRIVQRAIQHDAELNDATWNRLTNDLPPNVGVIRSRSSPDV